VVERMRTVGGVSVNTGTIPSKTMREAVMHLSGYNYRSIYGMNYRVKEKITMADLAFRVQHVIKTEIDVTEAQLSRNGIDILPGVASFEDATHVKVTNEGGTQTYEAKNIIIATGTKPADSPRVPINGRSIVNSDQILDLPSLPKSLIVVGGGVIGVEYTCMFAALGVRVTLIEKRPKLLEFADQEIVEALSYHLRDSRVTMRLAEEVESVEELPDCSVVANLESKKRISGGALLYAVGRAGNVDQLNLPAVGIEPDSRGRIPVDKDFRTKAPGIFAVGDVIGFPSLASVSMEQGRIAVARAFGNESLVSNPSYYPYGIYTIPEISFIGKTEEQLTDEDVPYEVGVAYYREIARGQIRGDTTGRLKIVFHRDTRHLLGVHIIGEGAAELLHIGQAVMALGGTLDYFIDTVFNYPTLAECYKAAAFNGINRLARAAD
jgi:NAD(P) transhydrogenase